MTGLVQDVRAALRSLRASRGFVVLSVLCLGLGIGVNTAIFSLVNGMLLRPLPFTDPDRLVMVQEVRRDDRNGGTLVSYANFQDWRALHGGPATGGSATGGPATGGPATGGPATGGPANRDGANRDGADRVGVGGADGALAGIAALRPVRLTASGGGESARVQAALVSWDLFPLLGVAPARGRGFGERDDRPGAPAVVLISDSLWQEYYAADPAVLGRSLLIDGRPRTIIGVMPSRFSFPRGQRLWLPIAPVEHASPRERRGVQVYARLAEGATIDRAGARLAALASALEQQHPDANRGWSVAVRPLTSLVPERQRALLVVLMGAVSFVLLIACANVGNLVLARATARRREIAIRTALGASRGRILRQLLAESLLVGLLSVPPGILLALWGLELLMRGAGEDALPYGIGFPIDARVLAYTIGLSVLTSLVFGLAPALRAVRGALHDALKSGGRESTGDGRQQGLRHALVVAEVALSLILLVGASLFVRSFVNLLRVDSGFDTKPLMMLRFDMSGERYEAPGAMTRRVEDIARRLAALPGVNATAASTIVPLRGGGGRSAVVLDGASDTGGSGGRQATGVAARADTSAGGGAPNAGSSGGSGRAAASTAAGPGRAPDILYGGITAGFFDALGVAILRGRALTDAEARTRSNVAVVNRRMAERLWPGQEAIGRRFQLRADTSGAWFTVVGVSGDIQNWDLSDRPLPTAYLPFAHAPGRDPAVVIRAADGDPRSLAGAARDAIRAADPTLPVFNVLSMSEVHRLAFLRHGIMGWIFGIFGLMAVLLASLGVYGVVSYAVAQRTREIGVRVALGAARADVVRLIVRQGMALVLTGIALGLAAAFALTRVLRRQIYDVSPTDPLSFAGVALLMAAIGLLAIYAPARRAASLDPLTALRE